jgi:hypothetical protein
MSEVSPQLLLPLIQPAQAQKHVTHNAAIDGLDVLVQLVVEEFAAITPPSSPQVGRVHALGAAPTGAWAGQANTLASFRNGGWIFTPAHEGWRAWGRDVEELRVFSNGSWRAPSANLAAVTTLGINATADTTNRLAVAGPATLLTHEGGDHQLKLNKANSGATGSLLFQTGFSGRAEMGLTGSDDFTVKVSADGIAFHQALSVDANSGTVALGKSLRFPEQPALSTDPNTLDAYVEGAWTPGFSASSTAPIGATVVSSGRYVRIGSLILATYEMVFSSKGSGGSGNVQITGFPVAAMPSYSSNIRHAGVSFPGSGAPMGRLNGTTMTLFSTNGSDLLWSTLPNNFSLLGSIVYIVNA